MKRPAVLLLAVQLILVLSIAGKYLYERKVCPRVWTRAAQFDPNQPLRGRYLALRLLVDACSLPRERAQYLPGSRIYAGTTTPASWNWKVSLGAENGRLVARLADDPIRPENTEQLWLQTGVPCDRVPLSSTSEYFIPDRARGPFPLKPGQELWVEVTLPPSGPPRPIQLAISSQTGFQPLKYK